jgi:hypothetical protein
MPRFAANLTFLYGEYPFLDRFAAAAADGELLATRRRLKRRIAHIQAADNPGRGEPGLAEVMVLLRDIELRSRLYRLISLFTNGPKGWSLAADRRPDLVISD